MRNKYETIIKNDLKCATNELNESLNNIVKYGLCITKTLSDISNQLGVEDHEKMESFNNGIISCFVCKNAQTMKIHMEKDCSYTTNLTPHLLQDYGDYNFLFEFVWNIQRDLKIQIGLYQGTVLYYTGFGIMHRQVSSIRKDDNLHNKCFWNIVSYGNKHLYTNARISLGRLQNKP